MRADEPPVVDGVLNDAVWETAENIGELTQVEPKLGAAPSERTAVRFLYDDDHLYVAVRCFDSEPGAILTTTRERDAELGTDDRIEILLDTFGDRRNAYLFQINAEGAKGDALVTNNGEDLNRPWDGIWEGRARVDGHGWTAELAIPFQTLSYAQGLTTWGLDVLRFIGRRREECRWSNVSQDNDFLFVYGAGELTGLAEERRGIGIDLEPFGLLTWENDRVFTKEDHYLGDVGADAFYRVTPNLTLSLTVNTDFAETEVDQRQLNLTRFSLFFPERRDFFLQDAGVFQFADLGNQLVPFFSRRIGLDPEGREVPILGGAKLTGRAGDYNIGVLDVHTDDEGTLDGQNLFVARVSKNVGEQSTVGAIVTHGNPEGGPDDALFGVDANFRTSSFRGDKNLRASAWALVNDKQGVSDDDMAFGASLRSPNDVLSWGLAFEEIQANFDPALGFVPRNDVRRYEGAINYSPRVDEQVRNLEFSVDSTVFTDTSNDVESRRIEVQPFGVFWESGDSFRIEVEAVSDELGDAFVISDGVPILPGEYDWMRYRAELVTAGKRDLSAGLTYETGTFYDGDRDLYNAEVQWRSGALFTGTLVYAHNDISLANGSFDTDLVRLRGELSFTEDLSWRNSVQWDSESDAIGVNSRLRWILQPGREVFLVFNETLRRDDDGSVFPLFHEVTLKVVYTLRL